MPESKAIYPGFFDPFTHGHLNIVERASKLFTHLKVAVAKEAPKRYLFDPQERESLIVQSVSHLSNVEVCFFSGLLSEFAAQENVSIMVRGIRSVADYEYESQMALANKMLDDQLETVFLMTEPRYAHLSSTIIKEIARLGGDISKMVPKCVETKLKEYYGTELSC